MKYVMSYRAVEDFLPLAQQHGPGPRGAPAGVRRPRGAADGRHLRRADERGDGIFTSREAAEEFVAGDPFVQNGVVAQWSVRPWNEILQP